MIDEKIAKNVAAGGDKQRLEKMKAEILAEIVAEFELEWM